MKFIGIDLGWRSQPSGLSCLEWVDGQLQLLDLDRKDAIADILIWIDATEDKLDSLICAYIAAYSWYWGEERNLVLGDVYDGLRLRTTDYIIIPQRML
ncbi:MAG: hypothetical protein V7K41_19255 [Nostoc sp.]|uniref:hypothetical protein n=1 Tax=Nostoc sp. TaxID=1180 RepID=UPI002FF83938